MIQTYVIGGIGEKKSNGGTQYFQQDRVYFMGDLAMCLPANLTSGSYWYLMKESPHALLENIVINDRGFIDSTIQVAMGICPSLRAETHGNLPKIIEKIGKS